MADGQHGCRGCPVTWGGLATCHCSSCHLTFSGVTTFDQHQVRGKCQSLRSVTRGGMREVRPGILGRPSPTQGGAE